MPNTDALDRTVFISDNLPFLRSLDSESIDLVVIDPPFGKRQTFEGKLKPPLTDDELEHEFDLLSDWGIQNEAEAYEAGLEFPDQHGETAKFRDIWDFRYQITEEQWQSLDAIARPARYLIETLRHIHSDDRAAYITFMALRIIELRRVLTPTGSLYVHCDKEASAYLKVMLDAIFGHGCFRDEIVWHRQAENLSRRSHRRASETILYYSRHPSRWTWNQQTYPITQDQVERDYRYEDERGRYTTTACTNNADRPNMVYEFHGITRQWRFSKSTMERYEAEGLLVFSDSGLPRRKNYLSDAAGNRMTNVWSDIDVLASGDSERTGYPTQKPQSLARRIIETSSNPGDLVLDCFAGCAYVPVAAELTGRRWIGCDMSPRAWTVVRRQFEKQPDLRIVTEGRRIDAVEQRLEHAGRVIKVRGPNQLPARTTLDDPVSPSFMTPPAPVFRQTAVETSQRIWEAFVEAWGPECWYCGAPQAPDRRVLQLDHIEPNARDGSNDDCWNRALACAPCNSDKSNVMTPELLIVHAMDEGRIPSSTRMVEQINRFDERRKWASERWECEVKPQAEQGTFEFGSDNGHYPI